MCHLQASLFGSFGPVYKGIHFERQHPSSMLKIYCTYLRYKLSLMRLKKIQNCFSLWHARNGSFHLNTKRSCRSWKKMKTEKIMSKIVLRNIIKIEQGLMQPIPANLKHSLLDLPSKRVTAKEAVNVSPAPVVSSTFAAEMTDCLIGSSPSTNRADPLDPSFTRTCLTP